MQCAKGHKERERHGSIYEMPYMVELLEGSHVESFSSARSSQTLLKALGYSPLLNRELVSINAPEDFFLFQRLYSAMSH